MVSLQRVGRHGCGATLLLAPAGHQEKGTVGGLQGRLLGCSAVQSLVPPGAGEVIGDASERRVEILSDADEVNATWSRFAPGRDGADLHVHRTHHDLFYVLDGTLTVRLGVEDLQVPVPAGTLVRVPPMVVHGFRNASDADMRYLNLHAPGARFADYLRAMRDGTQFTYDQEPPPQEGIRPPSEAVIGGEGEEVEGPGVREVLLANVPDVVVVTEVHAEPGHDRGEEIRERLRSLYVLHGELACRVRDADVPAPAGTWIQVPAGERLAFRVTGDAPARFLDVLT
jgi:mannose-6-phosphate isomerase-like protein (cupin superfamily)